MVFPTTLRSTGAANTCFVSKKTEPSVKEDGQTVKTSPSKLSRNLKRLKHAGLGISYIALFLLAGAKSGWGQLAFNEAIQQMGWVPTPVASNNDETLNGTEYKLDAFFNRHGISESVLSTIPDFDPSYFDINQNKIVLDTQEEVDLLKNKLSDRDSFFSMPEEAILDEQEYSRLVTVNTLNMLLWGTDANPDVLFQGGRPNCQIMGAVQSHFLTPEHFQKLKDTIEVTNYGLTSENFFMDTVVHLNGHDIEVPFKDLVKWMSPKGISPSRAVDGRLAIPILTYAFEKLLVENYEKEFPPTIPTSEQILMTGEDYSLIGISPFVWNLLTDDELATILSKAPEVPIVVVSHGDMEEFLEWMNGKIYGENKPFEPLPSSEEKANRFISDTAKKAEEISTNGRPSEMIKTEKLPTDRFPTTHVYVVKGYDPQEEKVVLIDSHGVEYKPLSMSVFREVIGGIVIPTKDVPLVTTESLKAYLLLLLFASGHIAINKRNKEARN